MEKGSAGGGVFGAACGMRNGVVGRLPPHGRGGFPQLKSNGTTVGRHQLPGALGTLVGVFQQHPLDYCLDRRREVLGANLGERWRRFSKMRSQEQVDIVRCERKPAGQQFVEKTPTAYKSLRWSTVSPRIISGLTYAGVPIAWMLPLPVSSAR